MRFRPFAVLLGLLPGGSFSGNPVAALLKGLPVLRATATFGTYWGWGGCQCLSCPSPRHTCRAPTHAPTLRMLRGGHARSLGCIPRKPRHPSSAASTMSPRRGQEKEDTTAIETAKLFQRCRCCFLKYSRKPPSLQDQYLLIPFYTV